MTTYVLEFSQNSDNDSSTIADYIIEQGFEISREITKNYQSQINNLFQTDYVLPIGKNGQFEAGYKGDFNAGCQGLVASQMT